MGGECERRRGGQDPAAHDIVFPEHDFDSSIHGYKKRLKADPERARAEARAIVLNTYRTLMTRGMKGCGVYCVDEETGEYFRGVLEG